MPEGWMKKELKSWYMFDIILWVINQKEKSQSYKTSLIYITFTIIYVSSDIFNLC